MAYERIPIVDAARRCGIDIIPKTIGRTEVEASCPFCGERPGKYHLGLNTRRDVFKCVLCGESGNSVSLYARLQSVSYGAAARDLLDQCKVYPIRTTLVLHML